MFVIVEGRHGYKPMSDKQLAERIASESAESDYNWFASASALVRATQKPGFKEEYSTAIRTAILNCYASIENGANHFRGKYGHSSKADIEAVHYCYNSLYRTKDEAAAKARDWYLREMIDSATHGEDFTYLMLHPGQAYIDFYNEWIETQFKKYKDKRRIDFPKLVEQLVVEFKNAIKKTEDEKLFEASDNEAHEKMFDNFKRFIKDLS